MPGGGNAGTHGANAIPAPNTLAEAAGVSAWSGCLPCGLIAVECALRQQVVPSFPEMQT